MQIEPDKVKNILVLRNDRFGEFLLNIPALRAIKERFGCARLIAVINPAIKELAESVPYIDEVIEWENRKHNLGEIIRLIGILKKANIDMAVMLNPSKEFNIVSFLSGIPIRAGYNKKLAFLLTHKIEDRKHEGIKHEIEYNLELAGLIGAKTDQRRLTLNFPPVDLRKFGIDDNTKFIVIHPWTSDPVKKWPLENFRELSQKIIRELGLKVVVVGGAEESANDFVWPESERGGLINLIGLTGFRQLAAILKKARLLVSCDSGPVHLAGCVNLPVLAIFRNDLAGKTAVRWGPVSLGSRVIESSSLGSVSVKEVFDVLQQMLAGKKESG